MYYTHRINIAADGFAWNNISLPLDRVILSSRNGISNQDRLADPVAEERIAKLSGMVQAYA